MFKRKTERKNRVARFCEAFMRWLRDFMMAGVALTLHGCGVMPSIDIPYLGKVNVAEQLDKLGDDNQVEEAIEDVLEAGAEFITGEEVHIDISGDSPESRDGKK